MEKSEVKIFYPINSTAWRKWLIKNHHIENAVWLVFYKKISEKKSITWSEAVDVALCFGWIDSKKIKIDDEASHQFFSKRKANSTWSKINKEKVIRLINDGLMMEPGLKCIETAKQNGSWTVLDEVEELIISPDLEKAFKASKGSKDFYLSLSKSVQKSILQWIVLAKRIETRKMRIAEIAELAGKNQKPRHLQ